MGFSTDECAWHQTKLKMLGRTFTGLLGFEFEKDVSTEYLHASGDEPIDIATGNKTYPGTLKMMKFEVDGMNDAALAAGYEDISEVPHEAIVITCIFKKSLTSQSRTITANAVKFSNIKLGMDQNAKMTNVSLPFLSMKTVIR